MYAFVVTILILFVFVYTFSKNKSYFYIAWSTCFLIFIIHDGLRWETGTDWTPYFTYFEKCLDSPNSEFEVGYVFISILIRTVTNEYTLFLIFYAFILYGLVFTSIKKYSISPFLSLFLYYCMTLPVLGMNRQLIALGICLFSIRYVAERKVLYFFLLIALAMLFHKSALIFSIVYFVHKECKRSVYFGILLISILIAFSGIINQLPLGFFFLLGADVGEKMDVYTDKFLMGDIIVNPLFVFLAILKRLIWILLLLLYPYYVKNKNKYYTIFFNINILSLVFYIIFNNTILQIVISRGLIYFNIAEIFIIPYVLTMFKNNAGKVFALVSILAFGIINMNKGMRSYAPDGETTDLFVPYKGLFINQDYVRQDH